MLVTQKYIDDVILAAQMCDEYKTHKKEMLEASELQTIFNKATGVMEQQHIHFPVEKRPWSEKSHKASSVSEALEIMERFFNGT